MFTGDPPEEVLQQARDVTRCLVPTLTDAVHFSQNGTSEVIPPAVFPRRFVHSDLGSTVIGARYLKLKKDQCFLGCERILCAITFQLNRNIRLKSPCRNEPVSVDVLVTGRPAGQRESIQ